jgi:putative SOS response-associated peptidase YedK
MPFLLPRLSARSDTLFERPTFSRLFHSGKTCLLALDGFFEWKQEAAVVGSKGKKGRKQPYFVYRKRNKEYPEENRRPFMLMAGLWTRVATGRTKTSNITGLPSAEMLDTFTIITTEACPCLQWLHTRMPVFIWDHDLARQWLLNPSQRLFQQLVMAAKATTSLSTSTSSTPQQQNQAGEFLDWHAVTTEMSTMKYRSADAIKPLPKLKTAKSFFTTAAAAAAQAANNSNNKSDSTDDKEEKKPLQEDHKDVSSIPPKPAAAAAATPSKKRPAAAINAISAKQQQASGEKSKTMAAFSRKKAKSSSSSSSSTPKKGSIPFFFSPQAKTEKK